VPALERRALEIGVDVRAEHMRPDVDWSTLRQRGWTALRA
jgi:DNA-binding transcriptional regulator YdaS (Cro superfamily)